MKKPPEEEPLNVGNSIGFKKEDWLEWGREGFIPVPGFGEVWI